MFSSFQKKILKAGHPLLRIPCAPLTKSDLSSPETLNCLSLLKRNLQNDIIGLSAPQVGYSLRILGYRLPSNLLKEYNLACEIPTTFLINPTYLGIGSTKSIKYESCSSVPGFNALVSRYERIQVQSWDAYGSSLDFEASGILSRIIQHEVDHLEGVLYTERMINKSLRHDSYIDEYEFAHFNNS
jgi:peptide deformylase